MESEFKIRVFFSKTCKRCKLYMTQLVDFSPILIDVDDKKNYDLKDIHAVQETPHTQILDSNNKVIRSFIGVLSSEFLKEQLESVVPKNKSKVKLSYSTK